jgi:opacity protein-like surface antigen
LNLISHRPGAGQPCQPHFRVLTLVNRLCRNAFGTHSFIASEFPWTVGPSIGILLDDRVEMRFEAVHRRFGYEVQSYSTLPNVFTQSSRKIVRGHLWEYPLMLTYHVSLGRARPYFGGGLSLVNGSDNTETQSTFTMETGSGPVTTTSIERSTSDLAGLPTGYYVVGGVDNQISYFSIRPELRYSHFHSESSSAETRFAPNQFEFVIGLIVHPFRSKK